MMGMGIPLICNQGVGDVDLIVANSASGYIVDDLSMSGFEAAALKIPTLLEIPREHIREQAFKYYDLESGISKYDDIYNQLSN